MADNVWEEPLEGIKEGFVDISAVPTKPTEEAIVGAVVESITGEIEGNDGNGVISTAEASGDDDEPAESEPMGATVGDLDSPVTNVTANSTTLEPSDTDTITSSLPPSESPGTME